MKTCAFIIIHMTHAVWLLKATEIIYALTLTQNDNNRFELHKQELYVCTLYKLMVTAWLIAMLYKC